MHAQYKTDSWNVSGWSRLLFHFSLSHSLSAAAWIVWTTIWVNIIRYTAIRVEYIFFRAHFSQVTFKSNWFTRCNTVKLYLAHHLINYKLNIVCSFFLLSLSHWVTKSTCISSHCHKYKLFSTFGFVVVSFETF